MFFFMFGVFLFFSFVFTNVNLGASEYTFLQKLKRDNIVSEAAKIFTALRKSGLKVCWKEIVYKSKSIVESLDKRFIEVDLDMQVGSYKIAVYRLIKRKKKEKVTSTENESLNLESSNEFISGIDDVNTEDTNGTNNFDSRLVNVIQNLELSLSAKFLVPILQWQTAKVFMKIKEYLACFNIVLTIISFLSLHYRQKSSINIYEWPEHGFICVRWIEFICGFKKIVSRASLSLQQTLQVQKHFFTALSTENLGLDKIGGMAPNWKVSFNKKITDKMRNGEEELGKDTIIYISFERLKVVQQKSWKNITLLFQVVPIYQQSVIMSILQKNKFFFNIKINKKQHIIDAILALMMEIYSQKLGAKDFVYTLVVIPLQELFVILSIDYNWKKHDYTSLSNKINNINKALELLSVGKIFYPILSAKSIREIYPNSFLIFNPKIITGSIIQNTTWSIDSNIQYDMLLEYFNLEPDKMDLFGYLNLKLSQKKEDNKFSSSNNNVQPPVQNFQQPRKPRIFSGPPTFVSQDPDCPPPFDDDDFEFFVKRNLT